MNRRTLWVVAQASVTAVLLILLVGRLDLNALWGLFVRLPGWFYLLSLAVVLAGQVMYAWRWRLLLVAAGVRAPFRAVIRQYFIGVFVNNFLPSTIGGDVAKVYLLGREYGYRPVTASVLLDRILGLGLLAAFAAITLWVLPMPAPIIEAARLAVSGVALIAFTALGIAAVGTGGLPARVSSLGPRVVRFAERLQRLRVDMAAALDTPALIVQAAAVVAAYFIAVSAVYVMFFMIQAGTAPSFVMTLGLVMTATVLSNVPISLNGLGLREQLHVVLLAPVGVQSEVAVAISLLLFGHLLLGSLVGLVFWMQARAVSPNVTARIEV
jgi:uncharacterized protein (TIRG00374 family)